MKSRLFIATLLAASFSVHAQPSAPVDQPCMAKMGRHEHAASGPGGALPPFLHGMKLSERQQDQVFELMHAQVPAMRQQEKQLRKSLDALRQLALDERFDETRAQALAQSVASSQTEMALLKVQLDRKVLALLSAEQRKQLAAKIASRPDLPL